MTHLLDTNTCIEFLRGRGSGTVSGRLISAQRGTVVICAVVVAELLYGALRSSQPTRNIAQVQAFYGAYASLPFNDAAAEKYAEVKAYLHKAGTPIGPNDMLIGAIALANRLTLVTHNTAEFGRVPGLSLEDWQIP